MYTKEQLQVMDQLYSLKMGKSDIIGRAYWKRPRVTIFVAKIANFAVKHILEDVKNDKCTWENASYKAYVNFLKEYSLTEIHEYLHKWLYFTVNVKDKRGHTRWASSENLICLLSESMLDAVADSIAFGYSSMFNPILSWMKEQINQEQINHECEMSHSSNHVSKRMIDPCHY